MKRIIALVLVLLLGFYVAWPAWTGYQIKSALDAKDAAALERKIDFASVRTGLRPAATQKVGEMFEKMQGQAGPTGSLIASQLKGDVIPKIIDTSLNTLVTPGNLIRVVSEGGTWKDNAERILREQVGKFPLPGLGGGEGGTRAGGGMGLPGGLDLGALGGIADKMGINAGKALEGLGGLGGLGGNKPAPAPAPAPATGAKEPPPQFGLGNIKRFAFLSPFAFEVGVAKDASATAPDVTAQMAFTGSDWKVVQVVPRL